jgi:hypothetical protein
MERAPDLAENSRPAEERDRLVTELRYAARNHDWDPSPELIDAIADWHVRAVASARKNIWVPGMAGRHDGVVEEALGRFHARQVSAAIGRLNSENGRLKQRLMRAFACIRFYAAGSADDGRRARAVLATLLPDEHVAETTV